MIFFFKSFLSLFFFNEFLISFIISDNFDFNINDTYLIYFFLMIYLNFFLYIPEKSVKLDADLILKFFLFFIKTPNFFLNYFINILKKIFKYLMYFKYRDTFNFLEIFLRKYSFLSVWWRPLFKKTSYFGFFRSNRSKWIK